MSIQDTGPSVPDKIYSPPVFPRAGEWDGGARLTRRAAAHELI